MRYAHICFAKAMMIMLILSACAPRPTATPAAETTESPATTAPENSQPQFPDFDFNNFDHSTIIDNEWTPMLPGMHWVYEGTALDDEGKKVERRIEFTVTDLTKVVEGVRTAVGWIEDYTNGKLSEKEIAFYAQDKDGNVWYFGEHPEDYENGKFIEAPTWIAGLQDAKPGIIMMAKPQLGSPNVYQGWGPAVEWSDYGRVEQMGLKTCVPVKCFEDVLVNVEANLAEKGAFQLKYFARGIGEVRVGWRGSDQTQEELELSEYKQLSLDELAALRTEVLELEKHAYAVSDVYRKTSPVEYPEGTPAIDISTIPTEEALSVSTVPQGSGSDVIIYASDLTQANLSELDFFDDLASPGGKLISLPNNGDELDPPPENDPHVTFLVQVKSAIPYRCWLHMKVGALKGASKANVIWAQFSDAYDETNTDALQPGSDSYLTAEGPEQEGWAWVECDRADSDIDSAVYFKVAGNITVRLQAGAEGVGFDQLLLSPEKYFDLAPSEQVIGK